MIGNLFKHLFKTSDSPQEEQVSKYMPEKVLPIDERFASNFTENGGRLIYCENKQEVKQAFINILNEINPQNGIMCLNKGILEEFSQYFLFPVEKQDKAKVFLSNCENLIADSGAILFTSNHIGQRRFSDLPHIFIIVATTSQLVNSLHEALRNINSKYKKEKPTNISDIRRFSDKVSEGTCTKDTYLLLLENLDTP